MSEDQRPKQNEEPGDEVEAHGGGKHRLGENVEAGEETEKDDEVEAHHHHRLGHPKKA
ncbi:MAG TPA: hypothetical protein VGH82_10695 [Gaiellaceae bacterium]|jgi:hypothetical protein